MLSPNRYTAEAVQTQHANEKPWTTQQNATQPEQSAPAVPAIQPATPPVQDPNEAPYLDPAEPILAADPTIDQETRANAWDVYHNSRSLDDLVRNLNPLELPDTTRQKLLAAKQVTAPVTPVEKAAQALSKMAKLDPQVLEIAEKYPHTLKMVLDAAVKNEPREG